MRYRRTAALVLTLLASCGPPAVKLNDARPAVLHVPRETSTTTSSTTTTVPRAPVKPRPTRTAGVVAFSVSAPVVVGGMSSLLRRIGGCESSGRADAPIGWTQPNRHSTASGGFQDLDSTWRTWAARFGADVDAQQYTRAMFAPPNVQIVVNQRALDAYGTGPWTSSRSCWRE